MAGLLVLGAVAGGGCLNRPLEPQEPHTTFVETSRVPSSVIDKIDLLLVIDNSGSMADKQGILAEAVPDLVRGLLNPNCVDDDKNVVSTPATPTDDCPAGSDREFHAVFDVHIGVVTSSLGSHGGDTCVDNGDPSSDRLDDRGELLKLTSTYQSKGFLAWDPESKLDPPGTTDLDTLGNDMTELVQSVGQTGCGFEASFEAFYRFLVDPAPYDHISFDGKNSSSSFDTTQSGIDQAVLTERKDFLRASSLLAIVLLSDENDCSVKEYSYNPIIMNVLGDNCDSGGCHGMVRARHECKTDPNDPCCAPCGSKADSCPADPTCDDKDGFADDDINPNAAMYPGTNNLRCYHEVQRYGLDFLYPIERYRLALTTLSIPDTHHAYDSSGKAVVQHNDGTDLSGPLVDNPIFAPDSTGAARTPDLVFFAGIVGVPWQDIAVDPNDLQQGFKDNTKLGDVVDDQGHDAWDVILGDPDTYKDPLDPHMIESIDARSGTNPITGTKIQGPNAPDEGAGSDAINGHEWTIEQRSDLQYACVFKLKSTKDCGANPGSCDCDASHTATERATNPLCEGAGDNTQFRAKAYPGIRHLSLIKALGEQGIVGSVCPAQLDDDTPGNLTYGYRASVQGIIDRLKSKLSGSCLSKKLSPHEDGTVDCLLIEARNTHGQCDKSCKDYPARIPPTNQAAVEQIETNELADQLGWDCFCEVTQLTKDDLAACKHDPADPPINSSGMEVSGWCYADQQVDKSVDPDIVKACPADERHLVRPVGYGHQQPGSTLFITCEGETQ